MQCQYYMSGHKKCARHVRQGDNYCWQHLLKGNFVQTNNTFTEQLYTTTYPFQTGGGLAIGDSSSPLVGEICQNNQNGGYTQVLQCVKDAKKQFGKPTKIVVWDFDMCISSKHTVAEQIDQGKVKQMFIQEIYRMASQLFQNERFLTGLQNNYPRGYRFVVASYGYQNTIVEFLKRMGIYHLFDLILTPATFNLDDGFDHTDNLQGKNVMLSFVQGVYDVPSSEIILVDDGGTNVRKAIEQGYSAVQCNATGALLSDLKKIQQAGFLGKINL